MSRLANPSSNVTYVDGAVCVRETPKAICVEAEGEQLWVPKSVLHEDTEVEREGDEGRLAVRSWFAAKPEWPW